MTSSPCPSSVPRLHSTRCGQQTATVAATAVVAWANALVNSVEDSPAGFTARGSAMPVAEATRLMTTEELLALPDDGVERWLIRGQLREKPRTVRNRWHSRTLICVAYVLENWLRQQPEPRGSVLGGEV